jgi:hypothetical protein
MIWKQATFFVTEVITYCVMSNHFHILLRIPEPSALTDTQLIERLEGLYGRNGAPTLLARQAVAERGKIDADIRQGLIERMGDVSVFMKELKQRFSLWYNRHHSRFGTLWAERFKLDRAPGCGPRGNPARRNATGSTPILPDHRFPTYGALKLFLLCAFSHALPAGKPAIRQVWKPAPGVWTFSGRQIRCRSILGAA